jgi:hypothetical protein
MDTGAPLHQTHLTTPIWLLGLEYTSRKGAKISGMTLTDVEKMEDGGKKKLKSRSE